MTLFKSQVYINKIKLTNIQLVFFVSELSASYAIPYCLNPENISPFTSNSTCHWMIPTEGLLFIEIIGFSKWLRLQRAPLPQLFRPHHRKNSARGQFISVWLLSHVWLFATPWTAAHQASLSINNFQSLLKLMPIESVRPSNHLIFCCPFLLLPSIFPSIRVFSYESVLLIRWPKYWSFSFISVLPITIQEWSPLGWAGWISLQSKGLSRVFSNTTVQKHQFFGIQLSL